MADEAVQGKVLEVQRKDGKNSKGEWTLWRFQIQDYETGEKRWYSWGDDAGSKIRTGNSYHFSYYTTENKERPEYPYRNIRGLIEEIDEPQGGAPEPEPASAPANRGEFQRSKEEMRWTEANHMATRILQGTPDQPHAEGIRFWADYFYGVLSHAPEEPSRVSTPATQNNPSQRRQGATEQPSGETIGPEAASDLMKMAEKLMGPTGRRWVIAEITKRWNIDQPQNLTDDQAQTIATLLDGGEEEGSDPVDELQRSFDEEGG